MAITWDWDRLGEQHKRKVESGNAKKLRQIQSGLIKGRVLKNGAVLVESPKGIQHWYSTRELVERVTAAFERNPPYQGRRVCYINKKWQLQIRGKHLRRLLRAMPNVKQIGNMLVEYK